MKNSLQIKTPPQHDIKLICVPGEVYNEEDSFEDQDGKKYIILDQYTYEKTDPFPYGMMLLATGKHIEPDVIWNAYKKSDKIMFFICKMIKTT